MNFEKYLISLLKFLKMIYKTDKGSAYLKFDYNNFFDIPSAIFGNKICKWTNINKRI